MNSKTTVLVQYVPICINVNSGLRHAKQPQVKLKYHCLTFRCVCHSLGGSIMLPPSLGDHSPSLWSVVVTLCVVESLLAPCWPGNTEETPFVIALSTRFVDTLRSHRLSSRTRGCEGPSPRTKAKEEKHKHAL